MSDRKMGQIYSFLAGPSSSDSNEHQPSFPNIDEEQAHKASSSTVNSEPLSAESEKPLKVDPEQASSSTINSETLSLESESAVAPDPGSDRTQFLMDRIGRIMEKVPEILDLIEEFRGVRKDSIYLSLEELLTRKLLELDEISWEGHDEVRKVKKNCVQIIEEGLLNLESKLCY